MTTDRAAALAAFAKRLRQAKREYFADNPTTLSAITPFDIIAYDMEKAASRPAQDIVAEMREKVEAQTRDWLKALIYIYSESIRLDHDDSDSFVCPVLEEITDLKMKMLHSLSPSDEDGQEEIEHSIREELAALTPTKNTAPTEAEES